eukprot:4984394-Pleurochrysis_carterae.AAC.1
MAGVRSVSQTRRAHLKPHSSLLAVLAGIPAERVASAWRHSSRRWEGSSGQIAYGPVTAER